MALEMAQGGLPVVVVNPSVPVGPGDVKPTPSGRLVLDFLNGRLPAYIDTGFNLVDVDDCARGHLLAAERGRVGERYVLGGENLSLRESLVVLEELTGLRAPRLRLPRALLTPVAHVFQLVADRVTHRTPLMTPAEIRLARYKLYFDSAKARRELGFEARPVREAFRRAVRWYLDEGRVAPARVAKIKLAEC